MAKFVLRYCTPKWTSDKLHDSSKASNGTWKKIQKFKNIKHFHDPEKK